MTETAVPKAPPALYAHCQKTYKAMLAEARSISDEGDVGIIIYEGFLTRLVTEHLHLSVPYYTHIRTALIRMGCIRQLKRGGGTAPSQWELIYEPTIEAFERQRDPKVPKQTKEDQTGQQINALIGRVADLETMMGSIIEALEEQFGIEEKGS